LSPHDVSSRASREKIDRRLQHLVPRHDAAQVLDPAKQPKDRVTFGARVTLREASGQEETWRIVGIDEMDLDQGDISWMSPLATAMLDKKVNDPFVFMKRSLTVSNIKYSSL
jgi:transcription elongation factor GreB